MNLKRGVGIDHCYKSKKQGGKDTLASIAIKSKETMWKTCTCQHWSVYLANAQLSQLDTIQIYCSIICKAFCCDIHTQLTSCIAQFQTDQIDSSSIAILNRLLHTRQILDISIRHILDRSQQHRRWGEPEAYRHVVQQITAPVDCITHKPPAL